MAQHPGDGADRRERQSVFVHLVGLCAVLEAGMAPRGTTDLLRRVLRAHVEIPALRRISGPGELTVLHVLRPRDLSDYEQRATTWATAVWRAWSEHHGVIRAALASVPGR